MCYVIAPDIKFVCWKTRGKSFSFWENPNIIYKHIYMILILIKYSKVHSVSSYNYSNTRFLRKSLFQSEIVLSYNSESHNSQKMMMKIMMLLTMTMTMMNNLLVILL